MLIGAAGKNNVAALKEHRKQGSYFEYEEADFYCRLEPSGDKNSLCWEAPEKAGAVVLEGRVYDIDGRGAPGSGSEIWDAYRKNGPAFLEKMNGDFSLVIRDSQQNRCLLARDKIGAGRLYYREENGSLFFSSGLKELTRLSSRTPELNRDVILKYLMFCYNPDQETVYTSVYKLRPAAFLLFSEGNMSTDVYWRLRFSAAEYPDEAQLGALIRDHLRTAVRKRFDPDTRTGAFLSGGLDSSSIVSLLHEAGSRSLRTFSFRCRGESFDESPFAEKVAKTFGTDHHLIEYGPEEVLLAPEMAGFMEEPFCDVGINIATFLLAREAAGKVDEVYTGDGGDELFAGHPVYTADKAARLLDHLPYPLLAPFFALGSRLRDSEKKKDLRVKIKRFSESYRYPKALGTHRWRVYYHPRELTGLVNPDFFAGRLFDDHLYADLIAFNRETAAPDPLARSLSSDYQTAVQFYLRRLDMAVRLGVSPRFPMLDPDVAAFCAGIPSALKLPGMSDVKHIEKIAVEPLLPREVVHRKDKLGHSIPLKNWMRDNKTVSGFMRDVLSAGTVAGRGIIRPEAVERMIGDHQASRTNNSHRLWALMILELWLQRNHDAD